MNEMTWSEKKERIEELINLISERHGGDEKEFLLEYKASVIDQYKDNLDKALACFEDVYGCEK